MPAPQTTIASRTNPRVKQLRAAFAGHSRLSGGLIAIEGEHLLFEAMRSGLAFKTIFLSQRASAPKWTPTGVELVELTGEVFASAVDTQSPQGIAALLVPPTWKLDEIVISTGAQRSGETRNSPAAKSPLILIAAGLQDPGNLGTLIRSAEAFGANAILATPGTVSEWNQKAIRASAGSVFRVPVIATTPAEIAALKSRSLHLFAAVADAGANHSGPVNSRETVSITKADLAQPCALMIGNEGAGLTPELLEISDTHITIPTPGRVESLNAAIAGSLLLYEAARQRALAFNQQPATSNQQPPL
jgi:RNA methyltransferase, TrmH family